MAKIIIEIDKEFEELGINDKEEYEKSVKNGIVLTAPELYRPDVDVEVKE